MCRHALFTFEVGNFFFLIALLGGVFAVCNLFEGKFVVEIRFP